MYNWKCSSYIMYAFGNCLTAARKKHKNQFRTQDMLTNSGSTGRQSKNNIMETSVLLWGSLVKDKWEICLSVVSSLTLPFPEAIRCTCEGTSSADERGEAVPARQSCTRVCRREVMVANGHGPHTPLPSVCKSYAMKENFIRSYYKTVNRLVEQWD